LQRFEIKDFVLAHGALFQKSTWTRWGPSPTIVPAFEKRGSTLQSLVARARMWSYYTGNSITAFAAEGLLEATSSVPAMVRE